MARSKSFPDSVDPGMPVLPACPSGWAQRKFGDVLRAIERPIALDDEMTYTLVNAKRSRGGIVLRDRKPGKEVKVPTQFIVREGDFVISRRQIIHGACGIVPRDLDGAIVSNEYLVLNSTDELSTKYLSYFSHTPYFQRTCFHSSVGVDVEKMVFKEDQWFQFPFPLPPLPEQKRIAAILSSVDDTIAKTESVIAQLQIVKKAMMEQLLTKGMPGRHTRFKQTEIGEIPEEWDLVKLRDVSQIVRGSTPRPARDPRYFSGDHTPWITVSELARDDTPYLTSTAAFLTEEGAKHSRFLTCGTVVISNSGFGLGVPKILQISGCANDGVAAFLHLSYRVLPLFLYYSLAMRTEMLRNSVARGVDQPNLNTTLIGDLSLQLPSLEEQTEIVRYQRAIDLRLDAERALLRSILSVKTSLSSSLLSGEIRVAAGVA